VKFPGDSRVSDANGDIMPAYRALLQALQPLTELDLMTLKALLSAGVPAPTVSGFAFGELDAFNETSQAAGGVLSAEQVSDILSLNISGSGNARTNQAAKALSLAIGSYSAIIPNLGIAICSPGTGGLVNKNLVSDRIYLNYVNIPSRRHLTALGWSQNSTSPGGNWSMSIYSDLAGPAQRLATTGTINAPGGSTVVRTAPINIDVDGGTYWLTFTVDAAVDARGFATGNISSVVGVDPTDTNFQPVLSYFRSATFDGTLDDETASAWTPSYSAALPALIAL
jgi:hypothetical protein